MKVKPTTCPLCSAGLTYTNEEVSHGVNVTWDVACPCGYVDHFDGGERTQNFRGTEVKSSWLDTPEQFEEYKRRVTAIVTAATQ